MVWPAIIALASALISAGAVVYSAQEQKKTAAYRAKLAEEAGEEVKVGTEIDVERHRREVKRLKAIQRAKYAKAGVKMEGSPLEVLADTQAQADLDEMIIRYGGQVRAGAYEREGMFARRAGEAALTSGYIGAGSSLLAGAYSAYSGYQARNPKTTTTKV